MATIPPPPPERLRQYAIALLTGVSSEAIKADFSHQQIAEEIWALARAMLDCEPSELREGD